MNLPDLNFYRIGIFILFVDQVAPLGVT